MMVILQNTQSGKMECKSLAQWFEIIFNFRWDNKDVGKDEFLTIIVHEYKLNLLHIYCIKYK